MLKFRKMASHGETTLSQEINAEFHAKRQRLMQLQQEEAQVLAYMQNLMTQAAKMQQLSTSARQAQDDRNVEVT